MSDSQAYALAAKYNARLLSEGKTGMRWVAEKGGVLKLVRADRSDWPTPAKPDEDMLL